MIIKNVKIIKHNKTLKNANVLIKNGKIKKIIKLDGESEKILIPGFIDMHIHGFKGFDAMDGKEAIEEISKNLAFSGTTSFLPTLMTGDKLEEKILISSNAKTINSKILGFHIEGPFISFEKKGAHNPDKIISANVELIEKFINLSKNKIKKITIAPENFDKSLLEILLKNKIIPSIGHTNASANSAKEFFDRGVNSATHLWNGMFGVVNRNPGVVEAVLNDDRVYAEIICDFIHVDREALYLTIKSKGKDKITLITDSIRPTGLPDGMSKSGGFDVIKKGYEIKINKTETIAGSGITMFDNFKNILSMNFNLEDAVKFCSYNAAMLLGNNSIGEIAEGKKADLIIMSKNLEIEKVLIDGKEVKNESN